MAHPRETPSSTRRADVDSLRAMALFLLIIFHVLLIYSGRDHWRLNSSHSGYWADYLMTLLTPWRMSAVFLIGGVAVRFMLERLTLGAFARERAARLLVAFAFAVIVLTPLQGFMQAKFSAHGYAYGYLHYLLHTAPFVMPFSGLGVPDTLHPIIWLPDTAHAWFLPYLFVYSLLAAFVWRFAPKTCLRIMAAIERIGPLPLLAVVALWLVFWETVIITHVPETSAPLMNIPSHLRYAPIFALGLLIGKSEVFTQRLCAMKYPLWSVAFALAPIMVAFEWLFLHGASHYEAFWMIARGLYGAVMLFSFYAFGSWALNRPSKTLTYASDAILPVYLLHQSSLVSLGILILHMHLPLPLELVMLLCAASLLPLLVYHVAIRRTPVLRLLFGMRSKLREERVARQPLAPIKPVSAA